MIKPVNGHLLIEPLKHEQFMATGRETYEEKGVVIAVAGDIAGRLVEDGHPTIVWPVNEGDIVLFDSWMCAKYPKNDDEFYWLVPWSEVRAVETNETLPE